MFNLKTIYFDDGQTWGMDYMKSEGVLVYSEKKTQPDSKKHVQYYGFECEKKKCLVTDLVLINNNNIFKSTYYPEIIKISYENKEAILRHADCIFTFSSGTATFTCPKKEESGTLGNHIYLHFGQHSIFK